MAPRNMLVAILTTIVVGVKSSRCPPPCPSCPDIEPCPIPTCPVPKCPPLPDIPPCPVPRCPSLPEIPACPTPVLDLSCPNVTCPPQSCPPCPSCPASPSCPPCSSNATTPTRPLPSGYERVPGVGAYKYYTSEMSWLTANSTCASDGAYLAIPDSQREFDTLMNFLVQHNEYNLHLGFTYSYDEGVFVTATGQRMTSEQNSFWRTGEPDSGRSFNCVYLNKSSRRMSDERCSDREPFICEMPA